MKKIIVLILVLMMAPTVALGNEQRKVSSDRITSSQAIKATPGTVYDIEVVATVAGGYAVIFDSSSSNPGVAGDSQLAEIREGVQFNSKHVNFGEHGIKAYKGIYLYLNDATAIVHYF